MSVIRHNPWIDRQGEPIETPRWSNLTVGAVLIPIILTGLGLWASIIWLGVKLLNWLYAFT